LIATKSFYREKVSAYECGFNPFGSSRSLFDIHFYLISILFIIFDLEIVFLFPWAINLVTISNSGSNAMAIFLIILAMGLFYEWRLGILHWKSYVL
jgi:NADH-quinone oxidoreductase subunit A